MVEKISDQEAIQEFVKTQKLLKAVNTFSIHTKLKLAGRRDEERVEAAVEAKEFLTDFLSNFEGEVQQVRQAEGPLFGVGPGLVRLAERAAAVRPPIRPIVETISLLGAEGEMEKRRLVRNLSEFRVLFEEHLAVETSQLFPQI